jgi:hypothetical protein
VISAVAAIVVSVVVGWVNHDCLDLVVASSNEKFVLLRKIAARYPAPAVDRRCVSVRVIQKASGAAERSLRRDWLNESLSLPRPDVWSPAATTWLILLNQHRKDDGLAPLVPPVAQSVIQSPLILAMPQPMADVLHQAFGPRVDWEQIFDLAHDQQDARARDVGGRRSYRISLDPLPDHPLGHANVLRLTPTGICPA